MNLKKLLLASVATVALAPGVWAAQPDGTTLVTVEDGNYYLYNESSGQFLGRGAGWGTQAILDNYGVPFSLTTTNGVSVFKFLDSANTLGNAGGTPYTDNANSSMYLIDAGSSSFSIYSESASKYISFDENGKSKFVDSNGTTWVIKSIENRNALVAANRLAQINANLKAAGIGEVTSEDGISDAISKAELDLIDATDKITNADFATNADNWTWTAGRSNSTTSIGSSCVEVYQGTGTLSQSVKVDYSGLYKVTFQALQRVGTSDNCITVGNLGIALGNSYFSANDSYAVIPDWFSEADTSKKTPSDMATAKTAFDAGKYTNDLYVYVGEDKTINLSFNIQSYLGAGWVIMGNVKLEYVSSFKKMYNTALAAAKGIDQSAKMNKDVLTALRSAIEKYSSIDVDNAEAKELETAANALTTAANNAGNSIDAYASFAAAYSAMEDVVNTTNVYSENGLKTYRDPYDKSWEAYNAATLSDDDANATVNPHAITGWHSDNTVDDLLLELWGQTNYDGSLYINTWSNEGVNDGSGFLVPFFEYWTDDSKTLGEKTWTATIEGLEASKAYDVAAWVRVRYSNGQTVAPYGISLRVGEDGTGVNVCDGEAISGSQFYIGKYTATGSTDDSGTLTINFDIAENNNVSWLSFKNVVYSEAELASEEDLKTLKNGVEELNGKIGFEEGEYAVYNNVSQVLALDEVNTLLKNSYINKDAYEGIVSKFNAIGNWTVNEEEVNAVYDGTFANAENNGAPAGWISSNNTLGGAYHARAFVNPSDNDISEFNETRSAFFIRFDETNADPGTMYYYGKTPGYTMPLKANTVYYVKADFKGWGSTGLPLRLNASNKSKTIKTTNQGNSDNVAPQHFYVVFKTTDAGDYTINFQNSGASEKKNAIVSNIELKKVPVVTRETATEKFGTVCLPYPFTADGATLYTVESVANDVVKLTEASEGAAGVAYIYQATSDAQTFAVADGDVTSDPATESEYLTGVFESTAAPVGNYVLQTQDGEQAFYKVAVDKQPTISAYRAYLTVPSSEEAALRISFNGTTTGVEAVKALTEGNAEIYDLNGRKLNKLQKGINIVNGVKVFVK